MAQTLYAPWRLDYIKSVSDGPADFFLCAAAKDPEKDPANLVLARSPLCLLMLNKYPYVNGHLLAAPIAMPLPPPNARPKNARR